MLCTHQIFARRGRKRTANQLERLTAVLRPLFGSLLFLSTMAACQSAMHSPSPSYDSTPPPTPIWSSFGQSPATAWSADGILPAIRLSLSGCAQENNLGAQPNQPASCVAETTNLPEAPSAFQGGPSKFDSTREDNGTRIVPSTGAVEQDFNRTGRTLDRKFILLHALSAVALVADLETTAYSFRGQAKVTELNPLFGAHPTRARLYGIAVPLNVLSFYVSYRYKKNQPGRSLWKLVPGLSIAAHTAATINNLIATHR